jgi:hypothetical protein
MPVTQVHSLADGGPEVHAACILDADCWQASNEDRGEGVVQQTEQAGRRAMDAPGGG